MKNVELVTIDEVFEFVLNCYVLYEDYYFMAFTLMLAMSVLVGVKKLFVEGT